MRSVSAARWVDEYESHEAAVHNHEGRPRAPHLSRLNEGDDE
jgi:hypothetical protein